jgi:hypothetical protein
MVSNVDFAEQTLKGESKCHPYKEKEQVRESLGFVERVNNSMVYSE